MGGESKTTESFQNRTSPWDPAQPVLKGILGGLDDINTNLTPNENEAIDKTIALAKAGNPYAPAIDSYAATMLAGGGPDRTGLLTDAYNRYKGDLEATARGDYLDPNKNPFFAQTTGAIADDIQNRVNAMYAGAGRDLSGSNLLAVAKGITEGTAPVFKSAWDQARADQLSAQGALYNAANTTGGLLSGLDQQRLANMGGGVEAAKAATEAQLDPYNRILAAEAQRRAIPLGLLQQIAGIATPIAGLGSTASGTKQGTQEMSGAQQFATILQGIGALGNLMPKGR